MSDRERVIRGLECCGAKEHCHYGEDGCPFYFPENPDDCTSRLARQALALLKEQPEIVLCKDCKHWGTLDCAMWNTWGDYEPTPDDWFCPIGEGR